MRDKLALGLMILVLPVIIWLVHQRAGEPSISFPPYDLTAMVTPGDSTGSLTLSWFSLSGDDESLASFPDYRIFRSISAESGFEEIGLVGFTDPRATPATRQYRDSSAEPGSSYYYKVACETDGGLVESNIFGPVASVVAEIIDSAAASVETIIFPATQLRAFDSPNDNGSSITLEWKISPNDVFGSLMFGGYGVYRSTNPDGPFEMVAETTAGVTDEDRQVKIMADGRDVEDGVEYYYYVEAMWNGQAAKSKIAGPVKSAQQWFHTARSVSFLLLGILVASILYYISYAKSGRELFIRKIAGLEAVDEAVGRATEMGRKIFFIPGIQDMNNMQTIAGLTILGRVAKLTAEYDTKLDVPVSRSLVMVAAREIVKEAYLNAGRPDYYNDDMVYYLTDDQFGYAAGVDGLVVREKPATIFYQGAFFAESLILAETGNSIGAIQIAGTAMPAQLPFFVAACDYTLIGEELFAASAYLSREPKLLGSLKGQDIGGKLVFLTMAAIFIVLATISSVTNSDFVDTIARMFSVH